MRLTSSQSTHQLISPPSSRTVIAHITAGGKNGPSSNADTEGSVLRACMSIITLHNDRRLAMSWCGASWSEYREYPAGQKGSDVSAREATRKIVAASRQLNALHSILDTLGQPMHNDSFLQTPMRNNKVNKAYWTPKNTIVRDVLNEIGNQQH